VLTSFLQSYLDKIRKEIRRHKEGGFMRDKQIGRFFKPSGKNKEHVQGIRYGGCGALRRGYWDSKTGELLVDNTVKVATCVGKKKLRKVF
jgi:hypothetical protein